MRSATAHSTHESEKTHPKRSASPSTKPKRATKRAKVDNKAVASAPKADKETQPEEKEEDSPGESAVKDEEKKAEGGPEGGGAATDVEGVEGQIPSVGFLTSMGTEKETERHHGLLESGQIFFLYRPKVELEEAQSMDDVAQYVGLRRSLPRLVLTLNCSFHLLLLPNPPHNTSDVNSNPHRLIVIGRKHLPEPQRKSGRSDIMWGEVVSVGDDLAQLKGNLGSYKYQAKTLGKFC